MSKPKHTPGPWKLGRKTNKRGFQYIDGPMWWDMIRVPVETDGVANPRGEANARLISKAPEVFELIQKVVEIHDMDHSYPDDYIEEMTNLEESARKLIIEILEK